MTHLYLVDSGGNLHQVKDLAVSETPKGDISIGFMLGDRKAKIWLEYRPEHKWQQALSHVLRDTLEVMVTGKPQCKL